MQNEIKPLDSTEITIRYVRAMGPVSVAGIASELLTQCQGITSLNHAEIEASRVITHGLFSGWLAKYDEESFEIAR
jgi:hypothetical protein